MNLRQKIKRAKKELKQLNQQENYTCTWDIYSQFEKKTALQNIINLKRNFNQYENDKSILKGGQITYMEFCCGMETLTVMKNGAGKPLSEEQKQTFFQQATESLMKHAPVIHARYKDKDNLPDDFHVMFCLYQSIDRTKKKRLVCMEYIYQFKNNKSLYIKSEGKWKPIYTFV